MTVIIPCRSNKNIQETKLYDPMNSLMTNYDPRYGYLLTTNISGIYTCVSQKTIYTSNFTFIPISKYEYSYY